MDTSWIGAAGAGFALAAGLIVAIGAQNAFVLRQGLRREHVGSVVLFCALADALLMTLGVLGAGRALAGEPRLAAWLTAAGALFLLAYALRALARAWHPGRLEAARAGSAGSRTAALAQAAAFTLLNPHVYLDTVLLVGAVGAQQVAGDRAAFLAGACAASAAWFALLGYGARRLAPWLARPAAWRQLDAAIGLTMLWLAAWLARPLILGPSPSA